MPLQAASIPLARESGKPGEILVRVVRESSDESGTGDDLRMVAGFAAAVINGGRLPGRVLDRTVTALASLPDCLSPLTGLIGIGLRTTLALLDALPAMRRRSRLPAGPKLLEAEAGGEPRRLPSIQRIPIG